MKEKPNVVVVLSRCSKKKHLFGMRVEKGSVNNWQINWAFPVKEKSANREGYNENTIDGSFQFTEEYPGCPHCHDSFAYKCDCGKVACYDGESKKVKCPWCGSKSVIQGVATSLKSGADG